MTRKEKFEAISQIADKILARLEEWNMSSREKWQVMMDFEEVDKICPLNFEVLLNNEDTLFHDYAGICMHFNRATKNWNPNACFVPRSAKEM